MILDYSFDEFHPKKMALDAEMPAPLLNLVYNRLLSSMANGKGESDWVEGISGGVSNDAGL